MDFDRDAECKNMNVKWPVDVISASIESHCQKIHSNARLISVTLKLHVTKVNYSLGQKV